jgi:hypothetical protein
MQISGAVPAAAMPADDKLLRLRQQKRDSKRRRAERDRTTIPSFQARIAQLEKEKGEAGQKVYTHTHTHIYK